MKKSLAITLAWPVFVAAVVCALLIYAVQVNNAKQRVESVALEDTNSMLTHLQNMLNSQLTSGNREDARLSFSVSAMHSGMQMLLLSDERDQVVLASRYIWEGVPASTLGHYDAALANQVRFDAKPIVKLSEHGNHLLGYYPVTLKIVETELGRRKLGVLYFEYDLALPLDKSKQEATNMALITGILLLLSAAVVIFLLRRLVSERIDKLVKATVQFSQGDLNSRSNISGQDEIALLAKAFDEMVMQRGKFEMDLQIKNVAIETSINAIAIVDLEGKHTYVNRAMLALWRLPSAEYALGRTPQEFVANPEQLAPVFEGVRRCGQWQGELTILRHDKSKTDVQVSAHLITDGEGHPAGMMGSFVDISERKQAEAQINAARAQLEATIEAIPDLLFDLSLEGTYYDVHAQNSNLLAVPENKLVGKSVAEMLPATAAEVVMNALHEANEKGRSLGKQFELNLPTGNFWFELSVARKKSADGETPRFIVLSRDITDRKRAIERLRNYNDELEQRVEERTRMLSAAKQEAEHANEAKSLFLSSMSHELRTPLNAILGYAQLMEMTSELSVDMRENAHEIRRAGNLLLDLVNDIIDLARIESGRLDLKLEKCALIDTLSECNSQNSRAAEKRRIKLTYEQSCNTVQLIADRRRLLQVFNNLISNAIKYNREGGTVTLSCTTPKAGYARIAVIDTGKGISPEFIPQLFQHFSRLGAELSKIEGTGIGLVITRHLVEGMGGEIGVESTLDKGTTFWVVLPTDLRPTLAGEEIFRPLINKENKTRVLVAEDYPQNQNLLRIQLAKLGCEVEVVDNGAEALKKSRSEIYDLILTDLNMPQMDGAALASAVRADELGNGKRVPIVAVTAAAEPAELERCRAAGMDDVLTKPVSIQALSGVLERWLCIIQNDLNTDDMLSAESADILSYQHVYAILGQVNYEQARSLIETFIQTTKIELQRLTVDSVDELLVARELHKQKSSAKTAGAMRYAQMAENLERRIKNGLSGNLLDSLSLLKGALKEVEDAFKFGNAEHESDAALLSPPLVVKCASVLVVDDDLVVLQQMTAMLNLLGVSEILVASNGFEALEVLAARNSQVEVMICDLDMPGMDGVELIREFSHTGFEGGLIFMSGADEKVLGTVSKLASLQDLRVLGQLSKPVTPSQMAELLSIQFVSPTQQQKSFAPFDISPESIRAAMLNNEFSIWLQPKVDSASLKPVGMEALARWKNAEGRFVPPDVFIEVAEQSGLIDELSQLLVFKALEEGAKVFEAGFPLKIAINLSGRWLNDLNLPDFVRQKTLAVGLKTEDVMLEVTETGVMEDLTTALDVLTRLRIKGFGLSIDDFGIGYSSLEQLGRIPFNEMKLDRSFVSKGSTDAAARAILESSMDMAQKLGLSTVAEGVETEKDLELIRTLGCERVQGYLIAKPMPLNDLLDWLRNRMN